MSQTKCVLIVLMQFPVRVCDILQKNLLWCWFATTVNSTQLPYLPMKFTWKIQSTSWSKNCCSSVKFIILASMLLLDRVCKRLWNIWLKSDVILQNLTPLHCLKEMKLYSRTLSAFLNFTAKDFDTTQFAPSADMVTQEDKPEVR